MHHGAVLAVDHADRLFHLDISNRIGKDGKWIEPEACQVVVALRMQRTSVLVRGQLEAFAVHNKRFFKLREQHIATHRGGEGSGEEAMIAPGVKADERR